MPRRRYIRERLEWAGTDFRSVGYVIAPAHNMQGDVPPENIVAWRDEMHAV